MNSVTTIPPWKSSIHCLLQQRNRLQFEAFKSIVFSHNALTQKEKELREKYLALDKELKQIKFDPNFSLKPSADTNITFGNTSSNNNNNNNNTDAKALELESKLMKLQEDLTQSYKHNTHTATSHLQATEKQLELQELNKNRLEEIEELKKKLHFIEDNYASLLDQKKAKDVTIHVLREELQALQSVLARNETKANQLTAENNELIKRWELKTKDGAEKNNAANQFYESVLQVSHRISRHDLQPEFPPKSPPDPKKSREIKIPQKMKSSFLGHKGEINTVAFNRTGSLFATGSSDKTVKLWDSRSGQVKKTLTGPAHSIMCVSFSPSQELVLGASNDKATRLWNIESGRVVQTLIGHADKVLSAVFSPDTQRVMTGSHDRTVKIWDLSKGYCFKTLLCYSSCNDVSLSMDGILLVSAHLDGNLRFWDTKTGECVKELQNIHTKPTTSVCFSHNCETILTSSRDNTLSVIDPRTYRVLYQLKDEDYQSAAPSSRACFSPEGNFAVAGGFNGRIFIWNAKNGKLQQVLNEAHSDLPVIAVAWSPLGTPLITCDKHSSIFFWED